MAGTQPLAAIAVAALRPANLTATLKKTVTAHPAATATKMTTATLDPPYPFPVPGIAQIRIFSPRGLIIPIPTLFLTPDWRSMKGSPKGRARTMQSEVFTQTIAEDLGVMVPQVELIRVEGMGEGMEVVVLEMWNVSMTMEMEMKIVSWRSRVLKLREGLLGAEDEEEGMPSTRR